MLSNRLRSCYGTKMQTLDILQDVIDTCVACNTTGKVMAAFNAKNFNLHPL